LKRFAPGNDTSYAVARFAADFACGSMVLLYYLWFVFARRAKTNHKKMEKYRCEGAHLAAA